jgi:hypothetical protein
MVSLWWVTPLDSEPDIIYLREKSRANRAQPASNRMKKGSLVRINYSRTQFPDFCPVCGRPCTTEGTIPALTWKQKREAAGLNGWSFTSSRVVSTTRSMPQTGGPHRVFIPVCDVHSLSFEDTSRARGAMAGLSGLFIVASLFLACIFGAQYEFAEIINTDLLLWLLVAVLGAACTYRFSGPTALERAVSVVDIQPDMNTLLLSISNRKYLDELLRLNPMTAERIGRLPRA